MRVQGFRRQDHVQVESSAESFPLQLHDCQVVLTAPGLLANEEHLRTILQASMMSPELVNSNSE